MKRVQFRGTALNERGARDRQLGHGLRVNQRGNGQGRARCILCFSLSSDRGIARLVAENYRNSIFFKKKITKEKA